MDTVLIRNAAEAEVEGLAQMWFDGWQDAHAEVLPDELRRLRTLESFRQRLAEALPGVRVAEAEGSIAGFAIVKGDELYQFYVARQARGTQVASILMQDALARLRGNGVATGWLACAIGNERAARFYEKTGWHRVGVVTSHLPTPTGDFPLKIWRYEIALISGTLY
ncbi:MAG: GNAT family N-acetyltransferase [Sphingomonas sp.]